MKFPYRINKNKIETNLFISEEKALKTKKLHIHFPNYELNKHGSEFLKFKNLKELSIQSHVDAIFLLPTEISQLSQLKTLLILNVELKEFPKWIFKISQLEYLMLRGHAIKEIPIGISQLKKLKKLRIENCDLTQLPIDFNLLTKLEKLSLTANYHLADINIHQLPNSLKKINVSPTSLSKSNQKELLNKYKLYRY